METTTAISADYQVQQDGLLKRINEHQTRAKATLDAIQRDGNLIQDFIMNLGKTAGINFKSNGWVKMVVADASLEAGKREFTLHRNAIKQAGKKLGMNATYIKDLADSNLQWKRDLIAYSLNKFVENTDRNRVLVRAVGDEVRGILTDYYKRIDSQALYEAYLEATAANSMQLIDANYDGLNGYVESVHPTVFEIPTGKNGLVYVAFGVRMRTGDFGNSPFEMMLFAFQTVCYNGMQSESAIREIHRGHRLPDNIDYAKDTLIADTELATKVARDAIKTIMKPQNIEDYVNKIQMASYEVVDVEKELKTLANGGDMNKGEIKQLESVITNNRTADGMQGENTLWKLSQAVGRVGVLAEDGQRKRELDALAHKIMTRK